MKTAASCSREVSEARANELGAAFEAWLLSRSGLTAEQGRWLALLGSQIRANADAWTEVSAGNFAFQPFSSMGGVGQAIRVFGGEKRSRRLSPRLTRRYSLRPRAKCGSPSVTRTTTVAMPRSLNCRRRVISCR